MRSIAKVVVAVCLLAACKRSSGTSDSHEGAPKSSAAPSGSAHARIVEEQKKLDVLTVWTTKNEFGSTDDFQDKAWGDLVDAFHANVGDALKKGAGLTVGW